VRHPLAIYLEPIPMSLRLTRLSPGTYEYRTPTGTYRVDHFTEGAFGQRNPQPWFLTYPGQRAADDCYFTLAEAREAIGQHAHA
jgi:hypothetical protein